MHCGEAYCLRSGEWELEKVAGKSENRPKSCRQLPNNYVVDFNILFVGLGLACCHMH